ncbi:MAG: adenylosuccinate synthetase, partial [Thermoguttaceae bacterium]|nr:adenylosuccinate synthetase [Thermoguttaceae bacterium]
INVCVAYELDGKRIESFPSDVDDLARAKPIYESLPGWAEEIDHIEKYDDLPENAKKYVARLEEILGRPISIVSVGPGREQTIVR